MEYSADSPICSCKGPSDAEKNLVAMFTFVARDAITGKSTSINPLEPVTEEEKAIFNERQAVYDARKKLRSSLGVGEGNRCFIFVDLMVYT